MTVDVADRDGLDLAIIRPERPAGFERDDPVVQGAGHRLAVDDALRERPTLVGAVILDGEDLVLGCAENTDLSLRVFTQRAPRSGMSSIVPIAIQFPFIASLRSLIVVDGRHRLELVLVLAGDALGPGSTWANFWLKTKRS